MLPAETIDSNCKVCLLESTLLTLLDCLQWSRMTLDGGPCPSILTRQINDTD